MLGSMLDWSYARLTPQQYADARAMGYVGALRYLGADGRCLTTGERDMIWSQGLRLAPIWETSARRPMGGYLAGAVDAVTANRYADAIGWPPDKPIPYATDFGPTGAEIPTVVDYYRGVLSAGLRPVAAYGCYDVIEALAPLRLAWHWQTCGWSGFGQGSGGSFVCTGEKVGRRLSVHTDLFQDLGARIAGTDHNVVLRDTVHRWTYHPSDVTPPEEDEPMAFSIAHCDSSKVSRMVDLGIVGPDLAFMLEGLTMRQITGDEAGYWTDLSRYVAAMNGKPDPTTSWNQFINDNLFWRGYTLIPRDYSEGPIVPQSALTRTTVQTEGAESRAAGVADSDVTRALVTEGASAVVDIEALAGRLAPVLVASLSDTLAAKVADILASRLAE